MKIKQTPGSYGTWLFFDRSTASWLRRFRFSARSLSTHLRNSATSSRRESSVRGGSNSFFTQESISAGTAMTADLGLFCKRLTGRFESRSQRWAVRTPFPRYRAMSFQEESTATPSSVGLAAGPNLRDCEVLTFTSVPDIPPLKTRLARCKQSSVLADEEISATKTWLKLQPDPPLPQDGSPQPRQWYVGSAAALFGERRMASTLTQIAG